MLLNVAGTRASVQHSQRSHGESHHIMVRTALVTGATGFLGRQVSHAFNSAGFQVVGAGFSRAKPPATLRIDLSTPAEISSVLQDVKYAPFLQASLLIFELRTLTDDLGSRPDVIVHCEYR